MSRRSLSSIASLVLALTLAAPGGALGQAASPAPADLVARLPATIDGASVEVAFTEDLATWITEAFAGETHPEISALETALAARSLSTADMTTTNASFGADLTDTIQGFQLPGGDAVTLSDAILDVYFIGFGELQRTDQTIAGQPVLMISDGPIETDSYPFAILLDRDVIWIASASEPNLRLAIEALVAVAAGTAPGNTGAAPADPMDQAPEEWQGFTRETLTWNRESFVGEWTVTFRGPWVRPVLNDTGYCDTPCTVYIPAGTIDWTWESSTPTKPRCEEKTSGSLATGKVVVLQDQMLYLAPAGPDHYRYWGSGTSFSPAQKCSGWDSGSAAGGFFNIDPAEDAPNADESVGSRPNCGSVVWRIPRDAASMSGKCWTQDYPGYEGTVEWDLQRVNQ
ncbi:MAG: hypothetical protein LH650_08655 [Chloroflexi bacterium]|nr:hypothetical protein [Chloroflexota bacterium]